MNVLYYKMGYTPEEKKIAYDNNSINELLGDDFNIVELGNGCAIVCTKIQPMKKGKRGKMKNLNRVIIAPVFLDGIKQGMESKYVFGDFFVCTIKNGNLEDYCKNYHDEVVALCGR